MWELGPEGKKKLPSVGLLTDLALYTIWGIWGSCYNIPKGMFYLLEGDYNPNSKVIIRGLEVLYQGQG